MSDGTAGGVVGEDGPADGESDATSLVPHTVVLDSDVMFDPIRRYLLLSLVVAGAFETRWSDALIGEWTRVIVREGRTTADKAQRQFAELTADFPGARCWATR